MKLKSTAVLLTILAVLAVGLIPLASEESSAEINAGDVVVTVRGHVVTPTLEEGLVKVSVSDVSISNSGETELIVFINNKSNSTLSINTAGSSVGDIKVTADS